MEREATLEARPRATRRHQSRAHEPSWLYVARNQPRLSLEQHHHAAAERIEQVLHALDAHGLNSPSGRRALYLYTVSRPMRSHLLPYAWIRTAKCALDGLCAYRNRCADPNVELMIHLLPKAGLFPAFDATTRLGHRVSQAERAAYLGQLAEYPLPQWSAMIEYVANAGVDATIARFEAGWGQRPVEVEEAVLSLDADDQADQAHVEALLGGVVQAVTMTAEADAQGSESGSEVPSLVGDSEAGSEDDSEDDSEADNEADNEAGNEEAILPLPEVAAMATCEHIQPAQHNALPLPAHKAAKIEGHVRNLRLQKAARILRDHGGQARGVAPAVPATAEALRALHPAGTDDPFRGLGQGIQSNASRITAADVSLTVHRMKFDSAAGPSGWTVLLWRAMLSDGRYAASAQILEYIQTLSREILAGTALLPEYLCAAAMTPLLKKDAKIRPIAVGEVTYRMITRTILRLWRGEAIGALLPNQFGVGQVGGTEAIIRFMEHAVDGRLGPIASVTKLDFSNAYNTLSRRAMALRMRAKCKPLFRAAKWAYHHASPLIVRGDSDDVDVYDPTDQAQRAAYVSHSQTMVLTSSDGVRQGDPLAPLFFSVGMQPFLEELQARLGDDHQVLAYLDDVIVVSRAEAEHVVDTALAAAAQADIGLQLNPNKCEQKSLVDIQRDGLEVLGTVLGARHAREAHAMKSIDSVERQLMQLPYLKKQISWLLLSFSIKAQPSHLLRQLKTHDLAANVWQRLDRLMLTNMRRMRNSCLLLDTDATLLHQPTRAGGLGLPAYEMASPHARRAMQDTMDVELHRLGLLRWAIRSDTSTSNNDTSQADPDGFLPGVLDGHVPPEAIQSQHERVAAVLRAEHDAMIQSLPPAMLKLHLEQQSKLARRWLRTMPSRPACTLDNRAIEVGLQLRTLCPPRTGVCTWCTTPSITPFHGEVCPGRQRVQQIKRHDYLRDLLARTFQRRPGTTVRVEQGWDTDEPDRRRFDIEVRSHYDESPITHIDLTVVEVVHAAEVAAGRQAPPVLVPRFDEGQAVPSHHWEAHPASSRRATSANRDSLVNDARNRLQGKLDEKERAKTRRYEDVGSVVGLAFSASGFMTIAGRDLLDRLTTGLADTELRRFWDALSCSLLRSRSAVYAV